MPNALAPSVSFEELFLSHLGTIETILSCICRRHRMSAEESEDFASEVKLRLIENDYRILRTWEGREGATLTTYLTTVITRMRLDYVRHQAGKYRPSEAARKLGPYAVDLERLQVRDELTFRQAFEQLRPRFPEVTEAEAEAMAAQLPPRTKKQKVGEEAVVVLPTPGADAETRALARERTERKKQLLASLAEARGRLPEEDQLIVKLLIDEGWKIVKIARYLNREAKPLYRHIQRIWDTLRKELERQGFRREDLLDSLGIEGLEEPDAEEPENR